ncbi:MAG TPA: hypothetical protein PLW65_09095, partial [Pseudomonadota bacterium]|nr:hypothetical protein [Pseudomonadota bacterium]
ALIAATHGYTRTAARVLAGMELPIELLLLTLPEPPAARAKALRPYLPSETRAAFLPQIYVHASALLELGYLGEVEALLATLGDARQNALILDVQACLHELRGEWATAYEAYRTSDWAVHSYRAALCRTIASGSDDLGGQELLREKLGQGMMVGGSETSQSEVARKESFVNACRWHDFDNWLISFELGSLCFQRRRHFEAERYLRAAEEAAPEAHRLKIGQLRFANLTWIGGRDSPYVLDMEPELLDCGHRALAAPGDEKWKTRIRLHLAGATGRRELLGPLDSSTDLYERGDAEQLRGNLPGALSHWSAALDSYHARACNHLISTFAGYGFAETIRCLVDIVLEESTDDFFALWELALTLRDSGASALSEALAERHQALEARLLALAHSEFQHLMRCVTYFLGHRHDIVTSLLPRADQLAESAEEHLMMAVVRRGLAKGDLDRVGLDSLLQAERESRDRVERLQLATEFIRYAQPSRARQILESEGLLDAVGTFEPLEYDLALQCGACLDPLEREALWLRAQAGLARDLAAGRFAECKEAVNKRLRWHGQMLKVELINSGDRLAELVKLMSESAEDAENRRLDEDSPWVAWRSSLNNAEEVGSLRRQLAELGERLGGGSERGRWLLDCVALGALLGRLRVLLDGTRRIRPSDVQGDSPLRKNDSFEPTLRLRRLSRLWRRRIGSGSASESAALVAEIRQFEQEEERLFEEWQRARGLAMGALLPTMRQIAEFAATLAGRVRERAPADQPWPSLLPISEHVLRDMDRLLAEVTDQMEGLAQEAVREGA